MSVNLTDLITQSDELEARLVALETEALAALDKLEDDQDLLQAEKADFYTKEHLIEVPGGAKAWNDNRRKAYLAENSSQAIDIVKHSERDYRRVLSNTKIAAAQVSGLNRKLRILELIDGREACSE